MTLVSVPNEILLHVVNCLPTSDRCSLACTSRGMHALVNPLIWANIEFHDHEYHETHQEMEVPPPFMPPEQHNQHTGAVGWKMLQMLRKGHTSQGKRQKELMAQIRSLCGVVGAEHSIRMWRLLPHMVNLQALEIDGTYWRSSHKERFMTGITDPPIPNLRYAKLFGYIPRAVANWVIFKCGKTLERLELGMLDRPVSPRDFPISNNGILDMYMRDAVDYLPQDWYIPRPLGKFLSAEVAGHELVLPCLKHVYLCRPSRRFGGFVQYKWSSEAEQESLEDWQKILQGCSKTLETIVVEDRPGATSPDGDVWASPRFMQGDKEGVGSKLLVEMLEKTLFEPNTFAALRHVYMYGIPICRSLQNPTELVPGGRLMQRLLERDIECEARLGSWCYFDMDSGVTHWERWVNTDDFREDHFREDHFWEDHFRDNYGQSEDEDETVDPNVIWDTLLELV